MSDEVSTGQRPGGEVSAWVPAFAGQRAPFAPGNTAAVRAGLWSSKALRPVVEQYLEAVLADPAVPYLREPRYQFALVSWATAEARVALLEEWVGGMTVERAGDAGPGRTPPIELLRKWTATAMTQRDRLGLTPAAAARLGKDVAQARQADVAAIMAEMHRQEQAGGGEAR